MEWERRGWDSLLLSLQKGKVGWGQVDCSLRYAGMDETPQGNGPKCSLHVYAFLSFALRISPVVWRLCDYAGNAEVQLSLFHSFQAGLSLGRSTGGNAAFLSRCSVKVHHVPCSQQLRICTEGHVPGATGLRAPWSQTNAFSRPSAKIQVELQCIEHCVRHFHMCCLSSCSEKLLEVSITNPCLQWECSESKWLDQGCWLIKLENWNVTLSLYDRSSALSTYYTKGLPWVLSEKVQFDINFNNFTWVLLITNGKSGLLQHHC